MHSGKVGKVVAITVASLLLCVAILLVAAYSRKRDAELRTRDWIVQELETRFESDVELEDFHVQVFPRMQVSGEGLSIHYRNRPETTPMIRIEKFSFELGFWAIFSAPHRIKRIHIHRMVITVPPRDANNPRLPPRRKVPPLPPVTAAEIECDRTELLVFSNKPGKDPLDWEIHQLVLTEVGMNKAFFFRGTLTNAKPKGEIATRGQFGPWDVDEPGSTPVMGSYGFEKADLGPFPGIGGILSSTGGYKGQLNRLEVEGKTDTPDFSLDNVGRPVPLHTDFSATVDGTNGDTFLHPVHAILGESEIVAFGSVENVPKQGHDINLDVTTPKARIEDILKLAINSDRPFLSGPVNIKAKLHLPPGKQKVIDKMTLEGSFAVTHARWSNSEVREKLQSFSRHAEGQPEDDDAGSAVTDLKGVFVLRNDVIRFSNLVFSVPGADVQLAGTYDIRKRNIDMRGNLQMQAKLSQTVTGVKSFFLKAIDPFFSKNGAGTVLPITITGPEDKPVMGVTVFHKKFDKQMGTAPAQQQHR